MKHTIATIAGALTLATAAAAGPKKDIVETAAEAGSFKTLITAVKAAGLAGALKGDGPLTVFAPTDEAFAKLPEGTLNSLLKPENKDRLIDILTYHVVPAEVPFKTAVGLEQATALNKKTLDLTVKSGSLFLNDSRVIENDIRTSNGIIHVIDTVLLPPDSNTSASSPEKVMMTAIKKGVPLFNHGQHGACADVYEIAARSAVKMSDLDCGDRKVLMTALKRASQTHCATTRAWTMRKAIDHVLMAGN